MTALVDRWMKVDSAIGWLESAAGDVVRAWNNLVDLHTDDERKVQQATAAFPALRQTIEARIAALDQLNASARQAREVVRRIARAEAKSLGLAVRDGETAFDARRAREATFEALGRGIKGSGLDGFQAAVWAKRDLALTRNRIVKLQAEFDALVAAEEDLLKLLAAAQTAQRMAREAGWLSGVAEPVTPVARSVPVLVGATTRALKDYPETVPDNAPAESAKAHNNDLGDRAADLDRLEDAIVYLELLEGDKTADMTVEQALLSRQRIEIEAEVNNASAQLMQDLGDTEERLLTLSWLVKSQARTLGQLQVLVRPANDEALRQGRQLSAEVESLLPAVKRAQRDAVAEWEKAYAIVHGTPPPAEPRTTPALSPPGMAPPSAPPPAPPVLRGHAYDFFDAWNTEREGYGAYTYILLRSSEDLRSPAVLSRYEHLLRVVQRQTDARDVPQNAARALNLFCIPVQASRERSKPILAYSSALGCQIKLRMQVGLFTRPELRTRLTGSPGPFLLTLPSRIDSAHSTSPLLFADLSNYPEAAITDLATAYMGTLLQDFPQRQTLWTPSVPQRVALAMIWFSGELGALLQTLMPAAQATPSNR